MSRDYRHSGHFDATDRHRAELRQSSGAASSSTYARRLTPPRYPGGDAARTQRDDRHDGRTSEYDEPTWRYPKPPTVRGDAAPSPTLQQGLDRLRPTAAFISGSAPEAHSQPRSDRLPSLIHPPPSSSPYPAHLSSSSGTAAGSSGGMPSRHDISSSGAPPPGTAASPRPASQGHRSLAPLQPYSQPGHRQTEYHPGPPPPDQKPIFVQHSNSPRETRPASKGSRTSWHNYQPAIFSVQPITQISPPPTSSLPPSPRVAGGRQHPWYTEHDRPAAKRSRYASPPPPITPVSGQPSSSRAGYSPRGSMPPLRSSASARSPPRYATATHGSDRHYQAASRGDIRMVSPESPPQRSNISHRVPPGTRARDYSPQADRRSVVQSSQPRMSTRAVEENTDPAGMFASVPRMQRGASRYAELEAQRLSREAPKEGWFQLGPVAPRDMHGWSKSDSEAYNLGYQDALYAIQEGVIGIGYVRYKKPHLVRDVPEQMLVEQEPQRPSKASDARGLFTAAPRYAASPVTATSGKSASLMAYPLAAETAIFRLEPPPHAQSTAPAIPPPSRPGPASYYDMQSPSSAYGTQPPSAYPSRPASATMSGGQYYSQGQMPPRTPSQLPPAGAWPPDVVHYSDIPRSAYYEAYQGAPGISAGTRPDSPAFSTSRPMRQLISCYPCRNRKLKCDGLQPCSQCLRRSGDEECRYADAVRRRGKGKKTARSEDTRSEASIEIIEPTTPERERMRVKREPVSPIRPLPDIGTVASASVAHGPPTGPAANTYLSGGEERPRGALFETSTIPGASVAHGSTLVPATSAHTSGGEERSRVAPFWRDGPPPDIKQEPAMRNGQNGAEETRTVERVNRVLPPLRGLEAEIPPPMPTRATDPPRRGVIPSQADRSAPEEIDELDEEQGRDGPDPGLVKRDVNGGGGSRQPSPPVPSGPIRIWEPPATPQIQSRSPSRPSSPTVIAKPAAAAPDIQEREIRSD